MYRKLFLVFQKHHALYVNSVSDAGFLAARTQRIQLIPQRNRALQEGYTRFYASSASTLPKPPPLPALGTPEETALARAWIDKFRRETIPKGAVELSFSRSSGPGGQNVNKVNTKATIRCPLNSAWIPMWAREGLKKDPHYVANTHSLLLTSTVHRSQSQNVNDCLSKLHTLILTTASRSIKNEATPEQKKRVEGLIKADNARMRAEKAYRSEVKRARGGGRGDW
ncbi:hypothetical protein BDQ12DRAFT_410190 [Crucibulum laeve]|uniref:Prokaryotic-type class I peptide chain release factors domain-containing protein n=1 Tax=Crucibulum laeve TaxID=68775 RepID=A0A5C3LJZ2_9AGAR|nr:hypothetical protein BDQ12DRAFT_410190 [Crucibulum laeve]